MNVQTQTESPASEADRLEPLVKIATMPTPEQIDALIAAYDDADRKAKIAKDLADLEKSRLILAVANHGHVPPHTEKSKLLQGRHSKAIITYGTVVTVNAPAVVEFESYLEGERLHHLFSNFFAQSTKYQLVESASEVMKGLQLARRVQEKIASLFGRCIDVKDKAPSLKIEVVEPVKPVRAPKKAVR